MDGRVHSRVAVRRQVGVAARRRRTMSSRKDAMWRWWSKFDQVQQLADIMSKSLSVLIEEYLAANPVHSHNAKPIGFDEYIMHRAITDVPDLLRLCPGVFFALMDVTELLAGNTDTRSREAFVKMAPILHPMAGTSGIAAIVFDELVADSDEKHFITRARFEQYLDALYKREFATNYAEHWSLIKEQCGLIASEKCILHTPYAADCTQFPPAVGSLYLSADHLVFQDPVLHNRRVIALHKISDVRRVPVELQHARMILGHLPGFNLLARGSNMSILTSLARLTGFLKAQKTNAEMLTLPPRGHDACPCDGKGTDAAPNSSRSASPPRIVITPPRYTSPIARTPDNARVQHDADADGQVS